MLVLLDNNVHRKFAKLLPGHEVTHVQDIGWEDIKNGDLIATAEIKKFQVLITADKNLEYQQNLTDRKISIIVLNSLFIRWEYIAPLASQVQTLLNALQKKELPPGFFVTVSPEVLLPGYKGKE